MFEQFFPFPAIPVIFAVFLTVAAIVRQEAKHWRWKRDCAVIDNGNGKPVLNS